MRLLIFIVITFLFPTMAKANCKDTDIVGAVDHVEIGTTPPVMITPISEINTYEIAEGFKILANSEIVTDLTSRVHITFVDGTSLDIGPGSRVKIDKFVYSCDPKRITEQSFKGFLRIITRQAAPPKMPENYYGSTGIRG